MTSKNSASNSASNVKMIISVIQRNLWLLVMAIIGFLFSGAVASCLSVQRRSQLIAEHAKNQTELNSYLHDVCNNLISLYHDCTTAIIIVGAILAAIAMFCYLTNRKKIDFYHSLPVSRPRLFAINYLAGFCIFLFPFVLGFIINACAIGALGYGDIFSWGTYFATAGRMVISFFCLYSIMVLAITVCGNILMSLLVFAAINGICPLIILLNDALKYNFYETYWSNGTFNNKWSTLTSPLVNIIQNETTIIYTVVLAVVGVLAVALALFLYQKRSSEVAGHSLAFKRSKHFIKLPIAFVATIAFAFIFYQLGNNAIVWLYFGGIVGAILICQFLEIWIEGEFAAAKRGWISVIAIALISTAVFVYMDKDLGHYDQYLPQADEVESLQLDLNTIYGYTQIMSTSRNYEESLDYNHESWRDIVITDPETIEAVLTIAQSGISHLDGSRQYPENYLASTSDDYEEFTDAYSRNTEIGIVYNLKNGGNKYRYYSGLQIPEIKDALITVLNNEDLRQNYSQLLNTDPQQLVIAAVNNFGNHYLDGLELSQTAQDELAKAYINEHKNLTAETMASEQPIGTISIVVFTDPDKMPESSKNAIYESRNYDTEYSCYNVEYPIYPSYKETISLIQQLYGENFFDEDVANIESITVVFGDSIVKADGQTVNETALQKRYENSAFADIISLDEFVALGGKSDESLTIHDRRIIKGIMENTCDDRVLDYTPFFYRINNHSYEICYNNDFTTSRSDLIK